MPTWDEVAKWVERTLPVWKVRSLKPDEVAPMTYNIDTVTT